MIEAPERIRYDGEWVVFDWGAEDKWYSISRKVSDAGPYWYVRSGYWLQYGVVTPPSTTMFTSDPFELVPEAEWPTVFDFLLEYHSR